ncbi:MAG: helix-turn-helix transcriptional regulator [Oscillospiraceae bacterium]|nr:helix-turn-helix transcriptional regulator [Oscillospiraceae bacterium]MBR6595190.1 helix-turn-helix transcriptional regulator [Oscillospiraceae bacterium]
MSALKNAREAKGLSQAALAKSLGVDQSTVCLWECGKTSPRPDVAIRLASILGCTLDDIYRVKATSEVSAS